MVAIQLLTTIMLLLVYAWTVYNLPIYAVGAWHWASSRKRERCDLHPAHVNLPFISVVVPVKGEERVVGRLLDTLLALDYPGENYEILVVEDGSTDRTAEICREYASRHHPRIRFFQKPTSDGKPSALNYVLPHARGEILAFFDADSVPEPDALRNAAEYFREEKAAAVQGRTLSINSHESMLTRLLSYEEAVWCEAYLRGKDLLNLFVNLRGSCQFIRRDALEKVNGFDERSLSEDVEISARLTENGYVIRYAPEVRSWQEAPSTITRLFKQRTRWYRGTIETAFKYGRMMGKLSKKRLDAEATLLGPFILITSLAMFLLGFSTVPSTPLLYVMAFSGTVPMFACGILIAFLEKPRRISGLAWVPFVYFYWLFHGAIAVYSALLVLLRRPKIWTKTEKTGAVCHGR
ncbi:MAG: glycosyltransferase family 2 protein [Candidatus Verstraetearchaeota archaeon]|nr:glycosyltransferase family 2 protein [Candidatus Verstraetearchaeota archaeon]